MGMASLKTQEGNIWGQVQSMEQRSGAPRLIGGFPLKVGAYNSG